nr:MAG TPA: hypothetical protein [Caudoviricetes sp.]
MFSLISWSNSFISLNSFKIFSSTFHHLLFTFTIILLT